ncbi:MAG: WXG100 family type VII secretion target [Brachybacterium tyrofermentans]
MCRVTPSLGADTAQLRAQSLRLRRASADLDALRLHLDAVVEAAPWTGPDAEAFRGGWAGPSADGLIALSTELRAFGDRGLEEAREQDVASDRERAGTGAAGSTAAGTLPGESRTSSIPGAVPAPSGGGYLHDDNPLIPDQLEDPAESLISSAARIASDAIGWGIETGFDALESDLDLAGIRSEGIGQLQRDADHLGHLLEDWATGERTPTYAELGAAGLVASGSAGVGMYEAATGEDTPFLDDRPGGIVDSVETWESSSRGPQDLQDLIAQNDALRLGARGQDARDAGQIGIQEVRGGSGGELAYIVQIPPTEGALFSSVPDAYGGQGNSRDWASNLRLIAGQHPAAMDDVRAAMEAAGIRPGSRVLLVGHSQGGIVATHLAADPSFNSDSGRAGTYDVTHTFSVGSPVQTVVPAQSSTRSVNVHHEAGIGVTGFRGDLLATTDLEGARPGSSRLGAPGVHEVTLAPYPVTSIDLFTVLEANHDSMGPDHDPGGGYSGSLARGAAGDPVLSALQEDLTGVYLGDDTSVSRSLVVTVGRGAP